MLGQPAHRVDDEADRRRDPAVDLVQVHRGQDADRDDDERRDTDLLERADDRVLGAAARRRAGRSCSGRAVKKSHVSSAQPLATTNAIIQPSTAATTKPTDHTSTVTTRSSRGLGVAAVADEDEVESAMNATYHQIDEAHQALHAQARCAGVRRTPPRQRRGDDRLSTTSAADRPCAVARGLVRARSARVGHGRAGTARSTSFRRVQWVRSMIDRRPRRRSRPRELDERNDARRSTT